MSLLDAMLGAAVVAASCSAIIVTILGGLYFIDEISAKFSGRASYRLELIGYLLWFLCFLFIGGTIIRWMGVG